MLATKIICPHCSKHLKTSKPLTVGHRVLCSRCGRSFPVRPDGVNGADVNGAVHAGLNGGTRTSQPPPTIPQALPHPHAAAVETVPEEGFPIPTPAPNRQGLWIGLIFGGLLLLMGTTLALVLYFATRKDPQDNQVEASTATPSEADASSADPSSSDNRSVLAPNRLDHALPPPPKIGNDPPLLRDAPILSSPLPEPEPIPWLPPEEQKQVNKAIDQGVKYLKKVQGRDGSWGRRVGLAALPGLTLLECGVPADDIRIQKALNHVRRAMPHLNTTYDLALAILFLDRLGDPSDEKRIRTCALRLVTGQLPGGGWTYSCRVLTSEQESDLLTVMQYTQPKNSLDLFVGGPNGSAPPGVITKASGAPLDKTIQSGSQADGKLLPEGSAASGGMKLIDKSFPSPEAYTKALARLPADLRSLPALQPLEKSHKLPSQDGSDNSNTQFAILGLSAANRHHLPLDRSLALIVQHFRQSEAHKGGWGYHYAIPTGDGSVTPAMTGAGLLGLAVGMGLAADHAQPQTGGGREVRGGRVADPGIEKGFNVLGASIGKPLRAKKLRGKRQEVINFYLLWSIERCGVLFNRREIAGKDWYPWGAELLVDHQSKDGSWARGDYPGAIPMADTCFALLFLKRANLAKDLTKKLEFFMEGKKLQGP